MVTYKRVYNLCRDAAESVTGQDLEDNWGLLTEAYLAGACEYAIRPEFRWGLVTSRENLCKSLQDAVRGINDMNYCNISYGDNLIPPFYCAEKDEAINLVLSKWANILYETDLGGRVSEDDWKRAIKRIRCLVMR